MSKGDVGDKIKVLRAEGTPQKQAVAEALSMERAGRLRPSGIYVPVGKKMSGIAKKLRGIA